MTGDIRSSWVDVTTAAGTRPLNKNGGVLELFSRFRRDTENRGFIRIKKMFLRSISKNKKIRFSEKKLGLGPLKFCDKGGSSEAHCSGVAYSALRYKESKRKIHRLHFILWGEDNRSSYATLRGVKQ